jgi:hypothetical protein
VLRGDLNQDGKVTGADLAQMLGALADPNNYQATHTINGHSVTSADLLAAADINDDGVITNADLQALLTELQNPNAANAPLNKSTILSSLTTGSDHYPIVADYTVSVSGGGSLAPVPEPSSVALLGFAGAMLCWPCRRNHAMESGVMPS